jgi:hypothetical protein
MLIVTRRLGQGIRVGEDVRVVLMEVRGKQVRLGIEAPDRVRSTAKRSPTRGDVVALGGRPRQISGDLESLMHPIRDGLGETPPESLVAGGNASAYATVVGRDAASRSFRFGARNQIFLGRVAASDPNPAVRHP